MSVWSFSNLFRARDNGMCRNASPTLYLSDDECLDGRMKLAPFTVLPRLHLRAPIQSRDHQGPLFLAANDVNGVDMILSHKWQTFSSSNFASIFLTRLLSFENELMRC